MKVSVGKYFKLTPVQILAIGFATVILIGAILLNLPIATQDRSRTPFIDCIFISTSATCVTGLVTVDTGTHWSYFGKTVIMFLIEIGGLGFMSFATLIALLLGKRITLKERLVMQEALNSFSLQGLVKMARYVLMFTFSIQLAGALLLSTQFIPEFGFGKGIYYSVFHSISAFCNAGFDILGEYRSLTIYGENSVIILTIGILVIIGGLGFYVWQEIYNYKGLRKLSLHSKVALSGTAFLIIIGTILMFIFESNNPGTMKNMSFKGKILSSFFAAVTPRTAGFNSISTSDMTNAGIFLTIILMFIGGAPGSTAGGIKVTTAGVLAMTVFSIVKGREDTEIYKKRIVKDTVYKSLSITIIGLALIITVIMLLSLTEPSASLEYIIYEATSAFGTVGMSLGLTTQLSFAGKVIVSFTMYCGRLGTLTVFLALTKRANSNKIKYPEEKILVG
ncbi:trk system potassium uptake protein TrkH [Clostridium pascui]|uniref:TrkH family potassium uptake protein n=1 Tax=Clostridium pascui TaxID=46609 RepID=UPI00195E30D4|nr:TrkH family potassium uptake protein [Clostridium pascui]MBM7870068.1 trk system potassium uptake protein TrkH [Clostridium pascui]